MELSSLPVELMIDVTTYLDPDSTLNFALTCKHNYQISLSSLAEHARLFSEYHIIDTHPSAQNGQDHREVWNLLKELIQNPRRGWHIQELNLPASRHNLWDINGDGAQQPEVPPEEDQAMFKTAARALERLYPAQVSFSERESGNSGFKQPWADLIASLESRISSGHDDAIIVILIHYLPYLKILRITDHELGELDSMLRWIAVSYKDLERAPHLPLRRLTYASVSHWDTEFCCSPDWACYLLSIPSLRGFAANAMGESPSWEATQAYIPKGNLPASNVQELFFEQCVFAPDGLETILLGAKDLKMLLYTDGGATVAYESYNPKRIIQIAETTVGHSLEKLILNQSEYGDLTCDAEGDLSRISLRGFSKLKSLQCEWHMLLPDEAGSEMDGEEPLEVGFYHEDAQDTPVGFDIRNFLPECLEELQMRGTFDDGDWDQLTEVFSEPNSLTPNLTKVRIDRRDATAWPARTVDTFGDEPAPTRRSSHPLAQLLHGHGYY